MSLTAGALSLLNVTGTTASVSSAVAVSGTAPYTYQWYRSTTTGFSPGGGNIIAGATSLLLNDSGLNPSVNYFYKVVATDNAGTPATATSSQLSVVTTTVQQNQNQFTETTIKGQLSLPFNFNTISCQVDVSQATALTAGQPVKIVDSAGGVPKVVSIAADSDEILGFVNYNVKDQSFVAGKPVEISIMGNVMWMYATGAIARGARVVSDYVLNGGVAAASASGGEDVVGFALDKATALGQMIRVYIQTPSFAKDS